MGVISNLVNKYFDCDKCNKCRPSKQGITIRELDSLEEDEIDWTGRLDLVVIQAWIVAESQGFSSEEDALLFVMLTLTSSDLCDNPSLASDLQNEIVLNNIRPTLQCVFDTYGDVQLCEGTFISTLLS